MDDFEAAYRYDLGVRDTALKVINIVEQLKDTNLSAEDICDELLQFLEAEFLFPIVDEEFYIDSLDALADDMLAAGIQDVLDFEWEDEDEIQ